MLERIINWLLKISDSLKEQLKEFAMAISLFHKIAISCCIFFLIIPGCNQEQSRSLSQQGSSYTSNYHKRELERKTSLFPIIQEGRWGFINQAGKIVVKPEFKSVKPFMNGLAAIKDQNDKVGYVNEAGKVVIEPRFKNADAFHEQRAGVKYGNKWGFVDQTGKLVIPAVFDGVGWFSEGRAAVYSNGLWGFIDLDGKFIAQPKFVDHLEFSEGVAAFAVMQNGRYQDGLIDRNGQIVSELEDVNLLFIEGFSDGLLPVMGDAHKYTFSPGTNLLGYIDRNDKVAIPRKFEIASSFRDGLAPVRVNGKWGVIDTTGQFIIEPKYAEEFRFFEGLAAVKIGQKYGFIDKTGNLVIQPRFSYASQFQEGLAAVQLQDDGQWGFIDHTGKLAFQLVFDETPSLFFNGLSLITVGNKQGYVNKAGQYVWSPTN